MKKILWVAIIIALNAYACKKQDEFLEVKANNGDVLPNTLKDYQAILDYDVTMNQLAPNIGIVSADNYYVSDNVYASQTLSHNRNAYVWAKTIYDNGWVDDWRKPYTIIAWSNIVLEGIAKIKPAPDETDTYNNLKGSACFYRAFNHFFLAQLFAKPYNVNTATTDAGIPLRLSSDVHASVGRASIHATYEQIRSDLHTAIRLLPNLPVSATRPCKAAAYAFLGKVYLFMQDYANAYAYSDSALQLCNDIIDFNTLNANASNPFPQIQNGHKEVVFYMNAIGSPILFPNANVDTPLYSGYDANDLRKKIFYSGSGSNIKFKGHYTGLNYYFMGIATNEIYLIRAEAAARSGNITAAMADLNLLLEKRWKSGTFVPLVATNVQQALSFIISERRKELPFTGNIRWEDLRRLNKEPQWAVTLKRVVNGIHYSLAPNDVRYVLPIPEEEIKITGIEQNPR